MASNAATGSILQYLEESRSIRQARLNKLNEFESFLDDKSLSSTPTEFLSPFQQKYQYATNKLQQLQQQLDNVRISPSFINTNNNINEDPHINHISPQYMNNHILSTSNDQTQSENTQHFPIHDGDDQQLSQTVNNEKMNKSHSAHSIFTNHTKSNNNSEKTSLKPLNENNKIHSKSQESLLSTKKQKKNSSNRGSITTSSDDTNPYTMNDIHPSFMKSSNNKNKKQSNTSSSISIRSQLLHQNEAQHQQNKMMRNSLMNLESKSDLLQSNQSISASNSSINLNNKYPSKKRKSPRKLTSILNSPKKSQIYRHSKSLLSPNNEQIIKYKPSTRLSVSFADHNINSLNPSTSSTINKVRQSILFETAQEDETDEFINDNDEEDRKSIFSSPRSHRSPSFSRSKSLRKSSLKSPKSVLSASSLHDDKQSQLSNTNSLTRDRFHSKSSGNIIKSPQSEISGISRRSTVYDLVEESERTLADKQSNIDTYRQSVLVQLKHAEDKRQIIMEQRYKDNVAMEFMRDTLKRKIITHWRIYTENEIKISYEYRDNYMMKKCMNQWKRMLKIIQLIKKKRYLRIWRNGKNENLLQVEKLLKFPTKSRWILLKIISILRMSRLSFDRKRYKIIMNKLFNKYGVIMVFVIFNTWRTLAQQKNVAAFKIMQLLKDSDTKIMIKTVRIWRIRTKQSKNTRSTSYKEAQKLHLKNIYKNYFNHWMKVFYHQSMTKMALFHWAKVMEEKSFSKWRNYTEWIIDAKYKADKMRRRHLFEKYFTFWVNEFIRMQNEREWNAWREANKSMEIERFERMKQIKQAEIEVIDEKENVNVKVVKNDEVMKQDKDKKKREKAYLTRVHSVETPSNNLFFPYCGTYGVDIKDDIDLMKISEKDDDRLSYVKHCELQTILIPTYDLSMATKYKK